MQSTMSGNARFEPNPDHTLASIQRMTPDESIIAGTQADVVLLAAYVFLALFFSFLCSIAEAVLLSITPSYIEGQREERPKAAALLQRLKHEQIDRSLAAILTLNTIAHTVGAIAAGAQASVVFGSTWFGVFSAAMTLGILFFSEIVPKTIGAIYWGKLAMVTALFVRMLIMALYPLVWVSERLTKVISRGKPVHIFSRDEFVAMTRVGEQSGQINDNESRIIQNLLRFGQLRVTDIMTPRVVVSAISEDETLQDAFAYITQKPFSRLPVYRDGIDHVTGFVLKDDVLLKMAEGKKDVTLKSLRRSILAVPETVSLSMLLDRLLNERHHIAVVVNEYGGTVGLVTLEDLVETLIGVEIIDETDKVDDMRVMARKLWERRAKELGIVNPVERPAPE